MKVRAIQNRRVKQVLEASLKVANQVACEQYLVGLTSRNVAVPLQDDAIFGEGTGLIGA